MTTFHQPVLLKEAVSYLKVEKGKRYLDATVGGGGHAVAILKLGGEVLGLDCDPEAIKAARRRLSQACPTPKFRGHHASWRLAQENFVNLKDVAQKEGFIPLDGILFDLGVSTHQLDTPQRGFSFNVKAPLDMRMDPRLGVTAADLINGLNKGELYEIFSRFGQENYSRRIAELVCRARRIKPIRNCDELAQIIMRARSKRGKFDRTHPATQVFQALRIVVNDELNNLEKALPQALEILNPGGRLVVISFHSGEDRIVKHFFLDADKHGLVRILTDKPVQPKSEEVRQNPRSCSAKLRAAGKN